LRRADLAGCDLERFDAPVFRGFRRSNMLDKFLIVLKWRIEGSL